MRRAIVLLLALVTPALPAVAQSDLPLRDYVHTVWTQYDGMPLGEIFGILQTSDGYLWVSTRDGLLKFDGMRFVRESPCPLPTTDMVAAADGGFWATCGARLLRRTPQGQFVAIPQTLFSDSRQVHMLGDRQGRPWFVGASIRYLEADGTGGGEVGLPTKAAIADAVHDAEGVLWVSAGNQVVRIAPDQTVELTVPDVRCLAPAVEGGIFAATPDRLWRLRPGSRPAAISLPPGVAVANFPNCMRDAGRGGLWVGTRQHGVALVRNGRVEVFAERDRNDRFINNTFIDREGTIWAGSTAGLHRLRKPMVEVMELAGRLTGTPNFVFVDSSDTVWMAPTEDRSASRLPRTGPRRIVASERFEYAAIGEDRTGRVWLSNLHDIGYVIDGRFVPVRDAEHSSIAGVWSFTRDGRGQLWALAKGVGVYRVDPGPPRLVLESRRAAARFLVSERFGTWISMAGGGVEQHLDGRIDTFRNHAPDERRFEGGAPIGMVMTIVEDDDSIWVGTLSGLRRWRRGQWTDWTSEHGLPGPGAVSEIATDRFGRLWMMTREGILVASRAQLDGSPDARPRPLSFARIGLMDGVVPHPGNMQPSPRMTRDRLGRLLFTTYDSVVRVDPSEVTDSSLAPPIVLASVTIDNRTIDHTTPQTFVEPTRLQFDYTSLSLRSPEHARFRYQLEGYDADWIEAGVQRHVTYGTLAPGSYRFRVTGAGSEGVWSETPASFVFHIAPVFWRTWWFRLTIGFALAVAIGSIHRLRVRYVTTQMDLRFEERLAERTRLARDLHDTLLQTVQGSRMVADHALKDSGDHPRMVRAMEQLSTWLARATDEGRAALNSLRTSASDPHDLAKVLNLAIDECRTNGGAEISMSVSGDPRTVHPVVADEVGRIAFEAIRNAAAHSGGARIDVALVYGPDLELRISDNGSGIEPKMIETGRDGHFGLRGMRERAERIGATLTVIGTSGSGTVVTLVVPGRAAG